MAEHKYAEVLRAIADGKPVEFMYEDGGYWHLYVPECASFHLRDDIQWRVKPKEKVKKWRWVIERDGAFLVTDKHYHDWAEFHSASPIHESWKVLQKVDHSMIEVDAE